MGQLAWLLSGTPPRSIGWGPGPLTALRQARHRVLRRPVRLCLLERQGQGTRFAAAHAFWVNQRSRVVRAVVNERPERADVVWVLSQDPLTPAARRALAADLARVRPGVPVLNGPETYDAYHRDDAFPRLAAAGVHVPRTELAPGEPTVYKAQGEQGSRKWQGPYAGPVPGYRAFELVDGRAADGLWWRHRLWYLAGEVFPEQGIGSADWHAVARNLVEVDRAPASTAFEREQVRLLGRTLGLDFFAVDHLRRRGDGLPVFLDVNVYPTLVTGPDDGLPGRGQWHIWDVTDRAGLTPADGRHPWAVFDEVMTRLAGGQADTSLASSSATSGTPAETRSPERRSLTDTDPSRSRVSTNRAPRLSAYRICVACLTGAG